MAHAFAISSSTHVGSLDAHRWQVSPHCLPEQGRFAPQTGTGTHLVGPLMHQRPADTHAPSAVHAFRFAVSPQSVAFGAQRLHASPQALPAHGSYGAGLDPQPPG